MDEEAKAQQIMEEARNSIGQYCAEECKAYCCRKGYLVITDSQADLLLQDRRKEFEEKGILSKDEKGKISLFMGNYDQPCPRLDIKTYMCTIHKEPNRPQACKDFPIFAIGKSLRLSPRCIAVKNDKMYPYVRELIAMGYKIATPPPFADIELFNVKIKK